MEQTQAPVALNVLLDEWISLEIARRELEDQLKKVKDRLTKLGELMDESMAESGIQSLNARNFTVYRTTKRYVSKAKGVSTDQVCAALRSIGRGDMVAEGYSASSLKSSPCYKQLPECSVL